MPFVGKTIIPLQISCRIFRCFCVLHPLVSISLFTKIETVLAIIHRKSCPLFPIFYSFITSLFVKTFEGADFPQAHKNLQEIFLGEFAVEAFGGKDRRLLCALRSGGHCHEWQGTREGSVSSTPILI